MAIKHFVEAVRRKTETIYERADLIPGTDKIRTYCANSSVYSPESSLKEITRSQYRTANAKKK